MKTVKLNLVVAVCQSNRGIGVNGGLPWRIPGDMAFFKKLTTETQEIQKKNAVIMGRKTWESIPGKFLPLAGRLNVVVSTTLQSLPSGVYLAKSFDDAIQYLCSPSVQECLETVFVIGGASLYKVALESPFCHRIYLTEVLKDFICDTFLPQFDVSHFEEIVLPDTPTNIQNQNDISYQFRVYQKVLGSIDVLPPVAICVAMELGRGFGSNGFLPWPRIKRDFEFYTSLVTQTDSSDKKSLIIQARKTWESSSEDENQLLRSVFRVIISTTIENCPEDVDYLVKSYDEAIEVALKLWKDGKVEKIWVLGGQQIFQEAINSPLCRHIYLSRILASFPCDVFLPEFEHIFKLKTVLKEELDEDSQVNIRIEVYEKSDQLSVSAEPFL